MQLGKLKPARGASRPRKRVGRGHGSGHGKTCGRGHKGQKARAGVSIPAWFEGGQMPLSRRVPKRGFRHTKRHKFEVVNVASLNRFDSGEVTPEAFVESGLVRKRYGRIKVLGKGEISHALVVRAHCFSDSARRKIEAAGGRAETIA